MLSSSRWRLNQATHSRVASSTASRFFQGARLWISSALYSPLIVSASALYPRAGFALVAVALAAYRRFNSGFGQTLAVTDRNILRTPIRMVDQTVVPFGLPVV